MKEEILRKLDEIEAKENVRILFCAESGSRAWGFASPDSDYDVRFIYIRRTEDYLRLNEMRDVIEWQLDDTLDINGWDLQKALRLLYKSNPALFEWSHSPIVYKNTPEWGTISTVLDRYFVTKLGVYHYYHMAHRNYREFLQTEMVKLKKYFYVLRPLLACEWILKHSTPPPMLFTELTDDCLPEDLREPVDALLRKKMASSELGQGKRIDALNRYIENGFNRIEKELEQMKNVRNTDWMTLNDIFLKVLYGTAERSA